MRKFLLGFALVTGIGFSSFAQETVTPSFPIDLETAVEVALTGVDPSTRLPTCLKPSESVTLT